MAHMIDMSNERENIAYVGDAPWHGLGAKLEPGKTVFEWAQAAGLEWQALEAQVQFDRAEENHPRDMVAFPAKRVLYRSDTRAPLSIVGENYQIVQPREIVEMFDTLTQLGGFELETMGSLDGGKRIWGLAKVSDGAPIAGTRDRVRPYILLATSFDGSLSTIAKFTAVRVVCHNTITIATGGINTGRVNTVRVTHNQHFDPDTVRVQMGIVANAWEKFQFDAGVLAQSAFTTPQMDEFLVELLKPLMPKPKEGEKARDVRERKGFAEMMNLFAGGAIGADLAGQTKWAALNAVTEYVDHHSGRSQATRLNAAWFGAGDALKDSAKSLLLAS